jgi:hypothetical protein
VKVRVSAPNRKKTPTDLDEVPKPATKLQDPRLPSVGIDLPLQNRIAEFNITASQLLSFSLSTLFHSLFSLLLLSFSIFLSIDLSIYRSIHLPTYLLKSFLQKRLKFYQPPMSPAPHTHTLHTRIRIHMHTHKTHPILPTSLIPPAHTPAQPSSPHPSSCRQYAHSHTHQTPHELNRASTQQLDILQSAKMLPNLLQYRHVPVLSGVRRRKMMKKKKKKKEEMYVCFFSLSACLPVCLNV